MKYAIIFLGASAVTTLALPTHGAEKRQTIPSSISGTLTQSELDALLQSVSDCIISGSSESCFPASSGSLSGLSPSRKRAADMSSSQSHSGPDSYIQAIDAGASCVISGGSTECYSSDGTLLYGTTSPLFLGSESASSFSKRADNMAKRQSSGASSTADSVVLSSSSNDISPGPSISQISSGDLYSFLSSHSTSEIDVDCNASDASPELLAWCEQFVFPYPELSSALSKRQGSGNSLSRVASDSAPSRINLPVSDSPSVPVSLSSGDCVISGNSFSCVSADGALISSSHPSASKRADGMEKRQGSGNSLSQVPSDSAPSRMNLPVSGGSSGSGSSGWIPSIEGIGPVVLPDSGVSGTSGGSDPCLFDASVGSSSCDLVDGLSVSGS